LKLGKRSFIPFVTAGHPDLESTEKIVLALAQVGASVIEVGIPFSDPVADGPTIQRSSYLALSHGYGFSDYIQLIERVRSKTDVGLIFMTYLNPVLSYGLEKLDREASTAGLDGILISDLTPEEYLGGTTTERLRGCNDQSESAGRVGAGESPSDLASGPFDCFSFQRLETVFLVAPTSTEDRLKIICDASTGFIYLVARTGVTGKQTQIDRSLPAVVRQVRRFTDLPVAVGFGIRSKSDVEQVWEFAEGAVVGSAIVDFIERNKQSADLAGRVTGFVNDTLLPNP
jgi:tryptophan synthase alpha chain